MANMGLLVTMTEPPPQMEEEFNAWYDTEHIAERLAITGFRSARRWVRDCKPGKGKYLATYELDTPGVLDTAEYKSHIGDHFTPWSRRCLGKAVVSRRWATEQINPGNGGPDPQARALLMVAANVDDAHEDAFNRWYDEEHLPLLAKVPGVLRARRFHAGTGSPRYLALYEMTDAAAVMQHAGFKAALDTELSRRMLATAGDWEMHTFQAYDADAPA
ncbi:MAG: hypothetical protein IPK29_03375 [Betaproteobacteria bacterium]|nr:hypothetical protein [Betaproteobacteria bacterium]